MSFGGRLTLSKHDIFQSTTSVENRAKKTSRCVHRAVEKYKGRMEVGEVGRPREEAVHRDVSHIRNLHCDMVIGGKLVSYTSTVLIVETFLYTYLHIFMYLYCIEFIHIESTYVHRIVLKKVLR